MVLAVQFVDLVEKVAAPQLLQHLLAFATVRS